MITNIFGRAASSTEAEGRASTAQPQQHSEGSGDEVECLGDNTDDRERSSSPSPVLGDGEDDRVSCSAGDGMDSLMGGIDDEQAVPEPSPCPGYRPCLPASPAAMGYPFGQHCSEESGRTINWSVNVNGAVVSLHSIKGGRREACTGKSTPEGEACEPCWDLQYCPKVKG